MVRMCVKILLVPTISLILLSGFVYSLVKVHKIINNKLVKLVFNSNINIYSIFLLHMNLNKQIKNFLNLFKEVNYILLRQSKNNTLFVNNYIRVNKLKFYLTKLNKSIYQININTQTKEFKPTYLIIKPVKTIKPSYNLTKFFLRKSKFFTKTKYSWIRQECKNIVHLILLFNIVIAFYTYIVYMKWSIKINLIFIIMLFYIITYNRSLFKLKISFIRVTTTFYLLFKDIKVKTLIKNLYKKN